MHPVQTKAILLSRFFDAPGSHGLPRPFGVLFQEQRTVYEEEMTNQIENAVNSKKGKIPLNKILSGEKTWEII